MFVALSSSMIGTHMCSLIMHPLLRHYYLHTHFSFLCIVICTTIDVLAGASTITTKYLLQNLETYKRYICLQYKC